jgi:predicted MFS family arabinose efflux permease
VPLVLGRVHELAPDDAERQRAAWSATTMAFALGQAAGAYGLSFLFARGGRYTTLFAVGAAALTLALAIDLAARLAGRRAI